MVKFTLRPSFHDSAGLGGTQAKTHARDADVVTGSSRKRSRTTMNIRQIGVPNFSPDIHFSSFRFEHERWIDITFSTSTKMCVEYARIYSGNLNKRKKQKLMMLGRCTGHGYLVTGSSRERPRTTMNMRQISIPNFWPDVSQQFPL